MGVDEEDDDDDGDDKEAEMQKVGDTGDISLLFF